MGSLPTVLIFTYPEHGQANVNLATSYELALAGVNVCIVSFAALRTRVLRLQQHIVRHSLRSSGTSTGSVTFYECKGIRPYLDGLANHGVTDVTLPHPHGVFGALKSYSKLHTVFCPWDREEYLGGMEIIKEILEAIKPDLVVVDLLFYLARDACTVVNQKFMVILPNSIKDIAVYAQPYAALLWKYPALSSGFSFPLKWWQVPLNIYLNIRLGIQLMTSAEYKQIQALRSSFGLKPMFGVQPGEMHICPALAETDFPFAVIHEEILLCGPIILPFDPLEESHPAMMDWLGNGPTVMINLGSHVVSDEKFARETAGAIRILIDHHDQKETKRVQVLWKAKENGEIQRVINEVIGKEIKDGRVKVLAWLEAEPVSILQHPNVICTVHHGGANSFYEGIWSGVPHIVLPVWLDTYDYACRVEFLNVGVFGNKSCAPGVRVEELGHALVRVTGDSEEAVGFRTTAKYLKELCRAKGNGRELAAAAILKEAGAMNLRLVSEQESNSTGMTIIPHL